MSDLNGIQGLDPHDVMLSNIPEIAFKEQRMADLQPRKGVSGLEDAVRIVNGILNGEVTKPVLLVGTPGVGKTHIARAAGIMALYQGWRVAYYKVAGLLDELRSCYETTNKRWDERSANEVELDVFMKWVKSLAKLLILDDLGLEKATEWTAEKLDQIIDERYENGRPIIITANSLEISPRILDRCKEGGIIWIKGESYRGLKK